MVVHMTSVMAVMVVIMMLTMLMFTVILVIDDVRIALMTHQGTVLKAVTERNQLICTDVKV